MHNQTPKGIFPESFSLINPAVQEELQSQDFFDNLLTLLVTDLKNFFQMHNQTPKGIFPESFSLIHPSVQEELCPKYFVTIYLTSLLTGASKHETIVTIQILISFRQKMKIGPTQLCVWNPTIHVCIRNDITTPKYFRTLPNRVPTKIQVQ